MAPKKPKTRKSLPPKGKCTSPGDTAAKKSPATRTPVKAKDAGQKSAESPNRPLGEALTLSHRAAKSARSAVLTLSDKSRTPAKASQRTKAFAKGAASRAGRANQIRSAQATPTATPVTPESELYGLRTTRATISELSPPKVAQNRPPREPLQDDVTIDTTR